MPVPDSACTVLHPIIPANITPKVTNPDKVNLLQPKGNVYGQNLCPVAKVLRPENISLRFFF